MLPLIPVDLSGRLMLPPIPRRDLILRVPPVSIYTAFSELDAYILEPIQFNGGYRSIYGTGGMSYFLCLVWGAIKPLLANHCHVRLWSVREDNLIAYEISILPCFLWVFVLLTILCLWTPDRGCALSCARAEVPLESKPLFGKMRTDLTATWALVVWLKTTCLFYHFKMCINDICPVGVSSERIAGTACAPGWCPLS